MGPNHFHRSQTQRATPRHSNLLARQVHQLPVLDGGQKNDRPNACSMVTRRKSAGVTRRGKPAFEVSKRALENIKPYIEVRQANGSGWCELPGPDAVQQSAAAKSRDSWNSLMAVVDKKRAVRCTSKLADEFLAVSRRRRRPYTRRENTHRMPMPTRAFAHFAWVTSLPGRSSCRFLTDRRFIFEDFQDRPIASQLLAIRVSPPISRFFLPLRLFRTRSSNFTMAADISKFTQHWHSSLNIDAGKTTVTSGCCILSGQKTPRRTRPTTAPRHR